MRYQTSEWTGIVMLSIALRAVDAVARREAYVMAYNDAFYFVGAAFLPGAVLAYMIKKQPPPSAKG